MIDHHDEFVSAMASYRVILPHARSQTCSYDLENLIPDVVTQTVVDEFEVIKVDKRDGDLVTVARCRYDRLLEAVMKAIPVCQSGQRIVVGLILQSGFILLVGRQIHRDHTDDRQLIFYLQYFRRQENWQFRVIRIQEPDLRS